MQALRVSLALGLLATLVSVGLGIAWGAFAGYVGGRIDAAMMRFVDIVYALPYVFIVIILSTLFPARQSRGAVHRHRRGGLADHGAYRARPDPHAAAP